MEDGTICIDGLIDYGLSVSSLRHLLALHADLLPLQNQGDQTVHGQ